MKAAMGKPWELTYSGIQLIVERIRDEELQADQAWRRASTHSPARTRKVNALIQDAPSARQEDERGRGTYTRSSSWGRGGSRERSQDTRGSTRSRERDTVCEACNCWHYETMGKGVCKFRPTDREGKPMDPEFKGWDAIFYASLPLKTRTAMSYRMREMKLPHPAYMEKEERDLFFKRVSDKTKGGRR
jgi:hypothetical protein